MWRSAWSEVRRRRLEAACGREVSVRMRAFEVE